jgi:hypothetical protein
MAALSAPQAAFLADFMRLRLRGPEKDGTIMPFIREQRTVESLVRKGFIRWVSGGRDGYIYNGVVITNSGREAFLEYEAKNGR